MSILETKEEFLSQNPQDNSDPESISFSEFKKSLGLSAYKYSDEQIEQMRILLDRIADMFFDDWLIKRNGS